MRKIVIRMAVGMLLILIVLTPVGSVVGRPAQLPPACQSFAFSTEEEFVTGGPEPADGNPIISDGDLLTTSWVSGGACIVCARNADLLQTFEVPYDLGLDAADVIDAELYLVAFSTELNSAGQFTAGDLLITNGTAIPNQSLTFLFGQPHDLGLDSVHFVGDKEVILGFLDAAAQYTRDAWLRTPELLVELLTEFGIDIWFSTSGTWSPAGAVGFLDGDLLSVRNGAIVEPNADLLPSGVPAGIPLDGVDFGLDAATGDRAGGVGQIHFSTELLFDGDLSFNDGDVLRYDNGVTVSNGKLVDCFQPAANFLGLDALHMAIEGPADGEIHGTKFHDLDANGSFEPKETGLERWTIHLEGIDAAGNAVSDVAITSASGVYSFTVPAGSYEVSEQCLDGWYQSAPPPPPPGDCGSGIHSVNLLPGQTVTDVDFGNYRFATVEGAKFNDIDKDGIWGPRDLPLGQWQIHLDGVNGVGQDVNLMDFTAGATGYFSFTVPPGSYIVSEVCLDGWNQTLPLAETGCGSGEYPFDPVSGQPPQTGRDFGNYQVEKLYLPVVLKVYP